MSSISKKIIPIILVLSLLCLTSSGQYVRESSKKPPLRDRVFYGGSFGLQFGTITNIQLSPVAGIWLMPRLAVAAGPSWQYYKDLLGKTNIYGGRGFMRFMFIQDLNQVIPIGIRLGFYVHGEYEVLNLESAFWSGVYTDDSRFWEQNVLAGLGLSQPIGMKSSFNVTFLWSVTDSEYQIYSNPEVRIDFLF
jgi:hypothetical protein